MLSFVASLGLLFVLLAIFLPTDVVVNMPVFNKNISFGLAEVPASVMFLTLCGLCTSVMWGGIFNLATEGLGKYTAAASGIFMVMVCGGGILSTLQSYIADLFGYVQSYWVVIIGLLYILYYALVGSRNVNKDIVVND
jgi:sugar transporter